MQSSKTLGVIAIFGHALCSQHKDTELVTQHASARGWPAFQANLEWQAPVRVPIEKCASPWQPPLRPSPHHPRQPPPGSTIAKAFTRLKHTKHRQSPFNWLPVSQRMQTEKIIWAPVSGAGDPTWESNVVSEPGPCAGLSTGWSPPLHRLFPSEANI